MKLTGGSPVAVSAGIDVIPKLIPASSNPLIFQAPEISIPSNPALNNSSFEE